MVSERRIAQSATLSSIVRTGERMHAEGTIQPPASDSVPERQAQRRVQRRRTVDSARTHDYQTADDIAARTRDDARKARYAENVQRVANIRKSTPAQRRYVGVLLGNLREHNGAVWQEASAWWNRLDFVSEPSPIPFALADKTIKRLLHHLQQPKGAPASLLEKVRSESVKAPFDPYEDIPDGRYAVDWNDTQIHFYRVSRWKGSKRIKLKAQASDTFYPVRGWAHVKGVLDEIRKDPRAAAERYAEELGQCYACGRTLTDEDSRRKGIGPICETERSKRGFSW